MGVRLSFYICFIYGFIYKKKWQNMKKKSLQISKSEPSVLKG